MTLLLGALSLMGLGIFGPGIASGLVSGAPQLGAGAAVGTAAGAAIMAGGAGLIGARAAMAAGSGGDRKSHTSELQSLMRNSYAAFCLKKHREQTYSQ